MIKDPVSRSRLTYAEKTISDLKAELARLKSETIKTMQLCECKKHYRLPSEKWCDKCQIAVLVEDNRQRAALELDATGTIDDLKEHEWVAVADRLPKDGQILIVSGGIAQYRGGFWWTGMEEPLFMRMIVWKVTHYMPLPILPETDK